MALAGVLAGILVGKLVYWQLVEHQKISLLAARQHQFTFKLPAQRGRIFDRNGQLLATDTPVANVVADPSLIAQSARPQAAATLSPLLGVSVPDILKQLSMPLKFEYLKKKVTKETADKIAALHLPGIALEDDSRRSYLAGADPNNPAASQSLAGDLRGLVHDPRGGPEGQEPY